MNIARPSQPNPIVTTIAYYVAFISLGASVALGGPSLPYLAENTASRLDQISIIFVFSSLGYMLGSVVSGRLYDRIPGHRLQALSLLLAALTSALVPVMGSRWLLVGVLFFLGIFQSTLDVGCNTLLTWIHGQKVGPFMNGLHFFFGAGSFLAPVIFAQVVHSSADIRWAYWIFAALSVPVAAWFWFLPSPAIRKAPPAHGTAEGFNGLFLLILLLFITYVGLEIGFGNWIYTYALRLELADEHMAAYLTSAYWGSFTVGRLLGIPLSTRLRPQTILLADLAGVFLAFGILLGWQDSSLALWIGTVVLGLAIASIFATGIAFAEQRLHLTGTMIGWILVGGGLGGIFFPWLIGQFFERVGPQVTMPILLVNAVLEFAILLVLILPRRKNSPSS